MIDVLKALPSNTVLEFVQKDLGYKTVSLGKKKQHDVVVSTYDSIDDYEESVRRDDPHLVRAFHDEQGHINNIANSTSTRLEIELAKRGWVNTYSSVLEARAALRRIEKAGGDTPSPPVRSIRTRTQVRKETVQGDPRRETVHITPSAAALKALRLWTSPIRDSGISVTGEVPFSEPLQQAPTSRRIAGGLTVLSLLDLGLIILAVYPPRWIRN